MTACSLGGRVDTDGEVTVTVWHFYGGRVEEMLAQYALVFEAAHPGVSIDLVHTTGADASLAAWRVAGQESQPDLLLLSEDYLGAMADDPGAVPFTGYFDAEGDDGLVPQIEATYTVGGDLLAAPFTVSTPLLYFDGVAFREAGLDPDDPPQLLDEPPAVPGPLGSARPPRGPHRHRRRRRRGRWRPATNGP